MSSFFRSLCSAKVVALLLALLMFSVPQEAKSQIWLQTARVVSPIQDDPTRAFLDTLVNVMKRKDMMVKRSPEKGKPMTLSEIENKLIDDHGIAIGSANYAFIDYRFTIDSGGEFKQEVTSVHFVFRLGPNQNDVPVLYLDAQQPWVKKILRQKGTSLETNEAALIPFYRHLGFAHISQQEESQVVEVGGKTVREKFDEEKQTLIRKVEQLMYESFV